MEKTLFDIDESKIKRLGKKIISAENLNLNTKNKSNEQMIKDIKMWIEEEVDCLTK